MATWRSLQCFHFDQSVAVFLTSASSQKIELDSNVPSAPGLSAVPNRLAHASTNELVEPENSERRTQIAVASDPARQVLYIVGVADAAASLTPRILAIVGAICRISMRPRLCPRSRCGPIAKKEEYMSGSSGG